MNVRRSQSEPIMNGLAEHFYVHLTSDSSFDTFGEQPKGNFKTNLATVLAVDPSSYEVGLASISFPLNYRNVGEGTVKVVENGNILGSGSIDKEKTLCPNHASCETIRDYFGDIR